MLVDAKRRRNKPSRKAGSTRKKDKGPKAKRTESIKNIVLYQGWEGSWVPRECASQGVKRKEA